MQRQHSVMAERELGGGGGVGAVKHPSSTSLRGDANLFLNLQSGNVNTSWVFSKPASFPEAAAAAVTVADFSAAAPATLTSLNQRTICRICDGPCAVPISSSSITWGEITVCKHLAYDGQADGVKDFGSHRPVRGLVPAGAAALVTYLRRLLLLSEKQCRAEKGWGRTRQASPASVQQF